MINAEPIISKMKNQKINYDKVLKKLIGQWEREAIRPKILLHSCCAPCSTYTLEFLTQYADIAIYFANSNIHPKNDYKKFKVFSLISTLVIVILAIIRFVHKMM